MDGELMPDKPKTDNQTLLNLSLERFKKSVTAETAQRELEVDDIQFVNGRQWKDQIRIDREKENRAVLTINRLPAFIDQVVGDQRQNRPRIKVRPVDDKSDPAVASVFTGIIKNIENTSQADSIRDSAFEQAVTSGRGYYAIHTRYCDEDSFDQEIYHRYIPNPFSVYIDSNAKLPDRSDMKWAFITDHFSKEEFKERFPEAKEDPWENGIGDYDDWYTEDGCRVAEAWYTKTKKKKIALLSNGEVVESKDAENRAGEQNTDGSPVTIVKERTASVTQVYQCIMSGAEILEGPTEWPGKYIPIVQVSGKEINVEGQRVLRGLVRWGKDPQRMYNYWRTTVTEMVALQPKAPWLVTPEQIEGYEQEWGTANSKNHPYLKYNNVPNAPMPQRLSLNNLPQGAFTEAQVAVDDMKATMGIYDASMGNQSNETSGKAIMARQREGDVATYAFTDNLSRSIAYEGRIIVNLIPKIYDTAKVMRIINPDESEKFVMVNQSLSGEDVKKYGIDKKAQDGTIYDLNAGKYDVVVETGPSYTTQRMEAAEVMTSIVQANPNLVNIIGDLWFKNMDVPGADEMSKRLKKTLPPELAEKDDDEQPIEPPPPPQPTPQDMIEAEKLKLEFAKLEVEKIKIEKDAEDDNVKIRRIALDTMQEVFHPEQKGM